MARRFSGLAPTVALALSGLLLSSCDGGSSNNTQVLGRTETREPSTTAPSATPPDPTSATPSTPSTSPPPVPNTAATPATTTTTTPSPAPCDNPLVGYTVTPPAGWYPSGDTAPFAPCEAFDRHPIATMDDTAARAVPIVFRSLGPVRYLIDPTVPAPTGQRVVLADTRLAAPMTAAGRPAARFEATSGAGGRSYTYLVDTGPTVLAAQYHAPPGQPSRVYAAGKGALDQFVASLRLGTPGCKDSTDPRCGAFYTAGHPPNAPIRIALPTQPVDALAGQPLTFDVTADDADADDLRITASDGCVQIIDAVAQIPGELSTIVRSPPEGVDGRFGPWRSSPRPAGHATLTVSRTFLAPGRYSVHLSVRSANTAFPALVDPYASHLECIEVAVAVR